MVKKQHVYVYKHKRKNGDLWQRKTLTVFWDGTQRLSNANIKFIVLKSGHKTQKDLDRLFDSFYPEADKVLEEIYNLTIFRTFSAQ